MLFSKALYYGSITCRAGLNAARWQAARAMPPVLQGDARCLWPRLSRDSDRPTVCCDSSTTHCEPLLFVMLSLLQTAFRTNAFETDARRKPVRPWAGLPD